MHTSKFLATCGTGVTITLGLAGNVGATSLPASTSTDFLQTATIDELVAGAENGDARCAALEWFGGTSLVVAMTMAASEDSSMTATGELGAYPHEMLYAAYAPIFVPLLEQAGPPADPVAAEALGVISAELTAAIGEMQTLGLTEDDLLLLQAESAQQATGAESESAPSDPEQMARFESLLDHDFASITFLDPDGALASLPEGAEPMMLWAEECPETSAMLNFDLGTLASMTISAEFSVTVGGSEPIVDMEVSVDGSVVTPDTAG